MYSYCFDYVNRKEKKMSNDITLNESLPPLLPEGEYTARYLFHETSKAFGDHKVYVHFEILDTGSHYLTKMYRAYRVRDFKGKSGKGGGVISGLTESA